VQYCTRQCWVGSLASFPLVDPFRKGPALRPEDCDGFAVCRVEVQTTDAPKSMDCLDEIGRSHVRGFLIPQNLQGFLYSVAESFFLQPVHGLKTLGRAVLHSLFLRMYSLAKGFNSSSLRSLGFIAFGTGPLE
jgi:hypothetical protein